MPYLKLYFVGTEIPQLCETRFFHPLIPSELRTVRGRTSGAYEKVGTFNWTSGVRALITLVLHSAAEAKQKEPALIQLRGGSGSLAASLDYSITKGTTWLCDMFGSDSGGFALIKRYVNRSNSERRRPGPVILSLNQNFLCGTHISVYLNSEQLQSPADIRKLAELVSDSAEIAVEQQNNQAAFPELEPTLSQARYDSATGQEPVSLHVSPSQEFRHQEFLQKFAASQDPFIQIPKVFSDVKVREVLKDVFRREILAKLVGTNIFSTTSLMEIMRNVSVDPSFTALASGNGMLVSEIDLGLTASGRLGISANQPELQQVLSPDTPLRFAFPPALVSSLAILISLKHLKGYNLELDCRYAHSAEIVDRMCSGSFTDQPDFCLLSIASAASVLGAKSASTYRPIMLMPHISHRVLQSGASNKGRSKNSTLNYGFLLETPSTTAFLFRTLMDAGLISRENTNYFHLDPDEAPGFLAAGDPNARTISWFPCTEFNRLFNKCTFDPVTAKINSDKEIVLFGHESLWSRPQLIQSIDIAIRDIWLDLAEGGEIFDLAIDLIFADRSYLNLLGRFSGLNTISRLNGAGQNFVETKLKAVNG